MSEVILITGAGSGIGLQTALALAARGHQVIAASHSQKGAELLQHEAAKRQVKLDAVVLDIRDGAAVRALAAAHPISVVINDAATGDTGPIAEVPIDRVRQNFETNVIGTLEVIQAVVPGMIARRRGRIINLSSMAGLAVPMFFNPYASTKAAIESITASLRNELKYFNVHAVLINPGRIEGGHNADLVAAKYQWLAEGSPYFPLIAEMKRQDRRLLEGAYSIESVVSVIVAAVESRRPKVRYAAPLKYRFGLVLLRLSPTRLIDWTFRRADRLTLLK